MTKSSNEDQNTLHRVDIENSGVDIDQTQEQQKVAEWAESLGFHKNMDSRGYGDSFWEKHIEGSQFMTVALDEMTFFYKAQQADRKRLLDKVDKQTAECAFWGEVDEALDQIRKEEL